jgi:hypothetical protein
VKTAVCTIAAVNYLAQARTLMASLAEHQPDWERFVLLADRVDGAFEPSREDFELIAVDDLPLPDFDRFAFRYSLLEFSTAVKPWLLESLFERGYDALIYLDPDIRVYSPLIRVEQALAAGSSTVLTPHLTQPLRPDDRRPNETDILRAGTYNLGFLGLRECDDSHHFLGWWQRKNEFDCAVDFAKGVFVDQRWIDLVPGFYENVAVLRDPGYNVAYWNLQHRFLRNHPDGWRVNDSPLAFFHWSGLDASAPESLSKHQNRYRLSHLPEVERLARSYLEELAEAGHSQYRNSAYAFGTFDDGTPIVDAIRYAYRTSPRIQRDAGRQPFALPHTYFNQPAYSQPTQSPLITHLMRGLWEMTPRLQSQFPSPETSHRRAFASVFVSLLAPDLGIPRQYVAPVAESLGPLERLAATGPAASATNWGMSLLRSATRGMSTQRKEELWDGFRRIVQRSSDR